MGETQSIIADRMVPKQSVVKFLFMKSGVYVTDSLRGDVTHLNNSSIGIVSVVWVELAPSK